MSDDEYMRQMELQRKAFEAQFGSLEEMGFEDKTKVSSDTESLSDGDSEDEQKTGSEPELSGSDEELDSEGNIYEDEDDEEFRGFDDDDQKNAAAQPVVIKFNEPTSTFNQPTKQQKKALMSGKSSLKPKPIQLPKTSKKSTPEDSENLQNDLELQRFLDESHILANFQNQQSGADLTLATLDSDSGPIGSARTHTMRNRLDKISSVNGIGKKKLEKMPMSMRKGMVESQLKKIAKYEQDAKDGGIVLSKVKKGDFRNIGGRSVTINDRIGTGVGKKDKHKKRARGLQIQSVGKSTRNGLVISQGEIDRINGTGASRGGKWKKKGRR